MNLPNNMLRKGLKNPSKALRYLYKKFLYKRLYLICRAFNQQYYDQFRKPGNLDVMEEDWDTLLLIDACRYDYFEEESQLPGSLNHRLAPGSMSLEFINRTFMRNEFHDTVYVTANPFAMEIDSGTFHDIISLIDNYYDNNIGTVPPKDMADAALEAHKDYPQKRIIVHFMQPHEPFLSDFGQNISDRLRWAGNQYHLPRGMDLTDLQRAYRENVNIILGEIEELISNIEGKIVVTSDHGELLGERLFPIPIRGLEHPEKIYEEELLRVPWLEVEADVRRDIQAEPPEEPKNIASETAEKRLKQLGYL